MNNKRTIKEIEKEIEEKLNNNISELLGSDWDYIIFNIELSEEFIEKYYDKFDWNEININDNLSEEFKAKIKVMQDLRRYLNKYGKSKTMEVINKIIF